MGLQEDRDFGSLDVTTNLMEYLISMPTGLREKIRNSWIYGRLNGPIFDLKGHLFDLYHGVKTMPQVRLEDLDFENPNKSRGGHYAGTEPNYFRQMMATLDIRFEDFQFIDFGSGMGRALLLASERPFKKIIGVEFSPELHAIADSNIRSFTKRKSRACNDLESVCEDAAAFELPVAPLVLYLFNPFSRELFGRVIENIEDSLRRTPREILVIYANPVHNDLFLGSNYFVEIDQGRWHTLHRSTTPDDDGSGTRP